MHKKDKTSGTIDGLRRAFIEFLTLPTVIIAGFLVLAFLSYSVDKTHIAALQPVRRVLIQHVFANAQATSDLLSAIAAGIISVTSITITLLLIVVQQSAASMTAQVFDQFLRRKTNQFYFGFFVGLALYSLITLATVNNPFNPVLGGTLAFAFTVVALYLVVLLMYTTINQMRPVEIIEAIHNHILISRKAQLKMIVQTMSTPNMLGKESFSVCSDRHGYVTKIHIEKLGAVVEKHPGVEVVLLVSIGSYVAFGDNLADINRVDVTDTQALSAAIIDAIHLERQRDIDYDAAYGIEQLETIAWTSISTSKSNPAPGLLTIRSLRNILARWAPDQSETKSAKWPIVYRDNTVDKLMDAFETLAIVSSESMQHQNYIEVITAISTLFDRLPIPLRQRSEDILLRILSVLGDHVLTAELEKVLTDLVKKLSSTGSIETARAVQVAVDLLAQSVGKLNSRATRVPEKDRKR